MTETLRKLDSIFINRQTFILVQFIFLQVIFLDYTSHCQYCISYICQKMRHKESTCGKVIFISETFIPQHSKNKCWTWIKRRIDCHLRSGDWKTGITDISRWKDSPSEIRWEERSRIRWLGREVVQVFQETWGEFHPQMFTGEGIRDRQKETSPIRSMGVQREVQHRYWCSRSQTNWREEDFWTLLAILSSDHGLLQYCVCISLGGMSYRKCLQYKHSVQALMQLRYNRLICRQSSCRQALVLPLSRGGKSGRQKDKSQIRSTQLILMPVAAEPIESGLHNC